MTFIVFNSNLWAFESNLFCKSQFIRSFQVQKMTHFPDTEFDYCQMNDDEIPPLLAQTMFVAGGIHIKIAELLKTTPNQLFSQGVRIVLHGDSKGSLGSSSGNNTVFITSFPDGNGSISPSTYAHEVGHLVASSTFYPLSIRKMLLSPLLDEGFPDLVAIGVTGKGTWAEDLPVCMSEALRHSEYTSNPTMKYFSHHYSIQKLNDCCEKIQTRRDLDSNITGLCKLLRSEQLSERPGYDLSLDESLFQASNCFHPSTGQFEPSICDPHRLGVPLTDFIRKISVSTFFSSLEFLRGKNVNNLISCRLKMSKEPQDRIDIQTEEISVNALLQIFQNQLTPIQKNPWEYYWIHSNMKEMSLFNEFEVSLQAAGDCPLTHFRQALGRKNLRSEIENAFKSLSCLLIQSIQHAKLHVVLQNSNYTN